MRFRPSLAIATALLLSMLACAPLEGGQSGSDLRCAPGEAGDDFCAMQLGDGSACSVSEQICLPSVAPRCAVPECSPELVAGDQAGANGIALDDSHVYWTTSFSDGDSVMRRSKAGGDPELLADNQEGASNMVLDDSYVYWIADEAGDVMRVAKSGGSPETLVQGQVGLNGIEVDETHVYYMTGNGGINDAVVRVAKAGGAPELIALQDDVWGMALDSSYVYWNNTGASQVMRRAKAGGELESVASDERGATQIAADADGIYWISVTELKVRTSAAPDQAPQTLASFTEIGQEGGVSWIGGIALDATHVYWTAYPANVVMRAAKSGGASEILAAQQAYPLGVAVDDEYIYWTSSSNSTVMRLSRCACDL